MRDLARRERRLAGGEGQLPACDEQREFAVEHVERLVVAVVHVQRRHLAVPAALLDERQPPVAGFRVDVDVDEVVDEPQWLGSVGPCEGGHDGSFP